MKTEKTFYFNNQKMLNLDQKLLSNAVYAKQNPVNCPKLIFTVPEDINL